MPKSESQAGSDLTDHGEHNIYGRSFAVCQGLHSIVRFSCGVLVEATGRLGLDSISHRPCGA